MNPLLAVADRIRDREPDSTILVLGTAEGLEARLVPQRGYELLTVARLPFPRKVNGAAFRFPSRFRDAVAQTSRYLSERGVDVVVGFGGYASAPAYIAATRAKLPLVIHEANAKPGMANRVGALFTKYVGVAFATTRLRGSHVVGMPLRREIENLDRASSRAEGLSYFGLDADKPVLLVTGGSLGARKVNATVSQAVTLILGSGWQVLHIAGNRAEVEDPGLPGYTFLHYCDRMDLAIAVADLAVARSGAATVSEFSAIGIPAVYVPYPVGNGEQRFNAQDAVAVGGARIVADADFTPAWISRELLPLLRDRAAIAEMAAATIRVGSRDGADQMVELISSASKTTPARD